MDPDATAPTAPGVCRKIERRAQPVDRRVDARPGVGDDVIGPSAVGKLGRSPAGAELASGDHGTGVAEQLAQGSGCCRQPIIGRAEDVEGALGQVGKRVTSFVWQTDQIADHLQASLATSSTPTPAAEEKCCQLVSVERTTLYRVKARRPWRCSHTTGPRSRRAR